MILAVILAAVAMVGYYHHWRLARHRRVPVREARPPTVGGARTAIDPEALGSDEPKPSVTWKKSEGRVRLTLPEDPSLVYRIIRAAPGQVIELEGLEADERAVERIMGARNAAEQSRDARAGFAARQLRNVNEANARLHAEMQDASPARRSVLRHILRWI
jgi:hypothetical protein